MNYILHLNAAIKKLGECPEFNPGHVSLYLGLFYHWNAQKFCNPLSICRSEVMAVSKIGSKTTYHRHLKDLEKEGFLTYHPSRNPYKGSLITMVDFSHHQEVQDIANNWPTGVQVADQHSTKNWSSPVQVLVPYINSNNNIKQDKEYEEESQQAAPTRPPLEEKIFLKEKKEEEQPPASVNAVPPATQGGSPGRASPDNPAKAKKFQPPTQEEATAFFLSQGKPEIEAEKFFNYYQANGWKVGGKTPMKDWQAAARNWIINSKNFDRYEKNHRPGSQRNQTDRLFVDNSPEKDYSKPL